MSNNITVYFGYFRFVMSLLMCINYSFCNHLCCFIAHEFGLYLMAVHGNQSHVGPFTAAWFSCMFYNIMHIVQTNVGLQGWAEK